MKNNIIFNIIFINKKIINEIEFNNIENKNNKKNYFINNKNEINNELY